MSSDPIVGHKTFADGSGFRHEPLHQSEADAMWASADAAKAKRATDMPTEQDAVRAMWSAYQRLRELGWKETMYGPTNKTVRLIEPGSTGIHEGQRHEPWPETTWWIADTEDLWPSHPCLFMETADETRVDGDRGRRLYTHMIDNDPIVHSNRFPGWRELSQGERDEWNAKADRAKEST